MSANPVENVDIFLEEIFDELRANGFESPETQLRGHAGIVLRTEAILERKVHVAVALLEEAGFTPLVGVQFRLNRNMVRELWRWSPGLRPTPEFCALMDLYCVEATALYIALRDTYHGEGAACERLAALKGPSRVADRRPDQLRARIDTVQLRPLSFVHTADTTRSFLRELGVFLAHHERASILQAFRRGVPSGAAVGSAIDEVYRSVPPLSLSPQDVSARIRAGRGSQWAEALLSGQRRDWRAFEATLDPTAVGLSIWDRVVIAAVATDADLAGGPPGG